jgi:hypothetical protein
MKNLRPVLVALAVAVILGSYIAVAQQQPAPPGGQGRGPGGPGRGPTGPMSFFITSVPKGDGANYGGLAGADAYCQTTAASAGRGDTTWHAYLSTQGASAVNARDRIGNGPWFNQRGQRVAQSVAELHGDTLDQARLGNALGKQFSLTEKGTIVNGVGDMPNQHDILTGSMPDGRAYADSMDHTCSNWTSNADGQGTAQLGHSDKQGGGNGSWNSTHPSRGCSQANLVSTGGAGLLYCFAVN